MQAAGRICIYIKTGLVISIRIMIPTLITQNMASNAINSADLVQNLYNTSIYL